MKSAPKNIILWYLVVILMCSMIELLHGNLGAFCILLKVQTFTLSNDVHNDRIYRENSEMSYVTFDHIF